MESQLQAKNILSLLGHLHRGSKIDERTVFRELDGRPGCEERLWISESLPQHRLVNSMGELSEVK